MNAAMSTIVDLISNAIVILGVMLLMYIGIGIILLSDETDNEEGGMRHDDVDH